MAQHRANDDPSASGAVMAVDRAERAERRVAALEATERYLTDQVRALGARLVATEQSQAELMSARAADERDAAWQSVADAISSLEAEIADRDLQVAALRDELALARRENEALRRNVDYVTGSRTWRVTKPARDVYRWIRRRRPQRAR